MPDDLIRPFHEAQTLIDGTWEGTDACLSPGMLVLHSMFGWSVVEAVLASGRFPVYVLHVVATPSVTQR